MQNTNVNHSHESRYVFSPRSQVRNHIHYRAVYTIIAHAIAS